MIDTPDLIARTNVAARALFAALAGDPTPAPLADDEAAWWRATYGLEVDDCRALADRLASEDTILATFTHDGRGIRYTVPIPCRTVYVTVSLVRGGLQVAVARRGWRDRLRDAVPQRRKSVTVAVPTDLEPPT